MPDRTREVFDSTATTYDIARSRLIPCFNDLYGTAIALIPESAEHILDLGAGTGLLSELARRRFPDAYLHLMDNSQPMLDQARELFSQDQRISFELADYTRAIAPLQYDAAISALSIHHLSDEAKKRLFLSIRAALNPAGVFVNAEQILAPTPKLEAEAKADWLKEVRELGATEDQIAASLRRQTEDRCATIEDQLRWMREAGFDSVRCVFARGRFAVLSAAMPVRF